VTTPGHVTLVDCTLRDGGYYNDWDYSNELITHYVDSMVRAGVDVIEMGFRQLKADKYLGPTAWTTDAFLQQLNIPSSITVAVMMNAKDVVQSGDSARTISAAFVEKKKSRVDMIRFAAIHSEVDALAPAVATLHTLGYRVAINLMQVSDRSPEEIRAFGKQCKTMGVEVAYIADSFGGLRPHELAPIMHALAEGFEGPVGCHLHDNMTYALSSTLAAVDAGATWVDATILGMGRGPGNVRTEYLAPELKRLGRSNIDVMPLVNLVSRDFTNLQRKHEWGSNLYYFLSANYGIHPTYVMELTKDGRYAPAQIVGALEHLNEHGGAQFDRNRLVGITAGRVVNYAGTFDASSWCAGKDVLIIGPGDEARTKKVELEQFVAQHKPVVIGLGAFSAINQSLIDAVAVCHPERAALEATAISQLQCPVFAPSALLNELDITTKQPRDVGVAISDAGFSLAPTQATLPRLLSAAYALALAAQGGAKRILVAGFDGFSQDDHRFQEMDDVFAKFAQLNNAPQVVSITRTRFNIERSSMFAPL
jgi:4-hydroxy 2-oxovalerate aldolase